MDFNRGSSSPQASRPVGQPVNTAAVSNGKHHKGGGLNLGKWTRIGYIVLLFAGTILLAAMAALIAFGGSGQTKYLNNSKFQAVFLNNNSTSGQSVYFGHIASLTDKYLVLQDIYYLTTTASGSSSSTANSNYQLTKLGCQQLHDPYDQMVINMSDVAFWENLHNGGKVVSAISQYQKNNPNGPNCSQPNQSVGTNNTTPQQSTTPPASTPSGKP